VREGKVSVHWRGEEEERRRGEGARHSRYQCGYGKGIRGMAMTRVN